MISSPHLVIMRQGFLSAREAWYMRSHSDAIFIRGTYYPYISIALIPTIPCNKRVFVPRQVMSAAKFDGAPVNLAWDYFVLWRTCWHIFMPHYGKWRGTFFYTFFFFDFFSLLLSSVFYIPCSLVLASCPWSSCALLLFELWTVFGKFVLVLLLRSLVEFFCEISEVELMN